MTYNEAMPTIIETPTFQRLWPAYWTEEERAEFAAYLAQSPEAGDVVKSSGGVRKITLLFLYAKNEFDSIAGEKLKELKNAIEKTYGR